MNARSRQGSAGDPQRVRVVRAPLSRAAVDAAQGILSAAELARAATYRTERDRDRFVAARGVLRRVLGRETGMAPGAIRLLAGGGGKPVIAGDTRGLSFNLSHAGGWVVVAIARPGPVGIDLEPLRPLADVDDLARDHLAPSEQDEIFAVPAHLRAASFLERWVCREAYVKALGVGLHRDTRTFVVTLSDGRAPRVIDSEAVPPFSLAMVDAIEGHLCAVAVAGATAPEVVVGDL